MAHPIIRRSCPVTLVGAGLATRAEIRAALRLAPDLVAADGGANVAVAEGLVPEAVIGDLDSVSAAARAAIPAERFHAVAEQDSTDFEKSLTRIAAPLVIAVGFSGPRLDHALATLSVLSRHPQRRCLLLGGEDVIFLAPPRLRLDLAPGERVSLFPMGPVSGRSAGLFWPIDGIPFAPDGRVGTSNRAEGAVEIAFDAPKMLVALPAARLDLAVSALLAASGWPAAHGPTGGARGR